MPDQQLVVARRKGTEENPVLSTMMTIEQLTKSLNDRLPVDKIYLVHPTEAGYSLQEVGVLTLDIISTGHQASVSPPPAPPPAPEKETPTPVAPFQADSLANQNPWGQAQNDDEDAFKFTPPRSQAELLKEKGLEQPITTTKRSTPLKGRKASRTKSSKKSKGKARPVKNNPTKPNVDDFSDEAMARLPNPISRGAQREVTGIRDATPEEAAKASQFGKRY